MTTARPPVNPGQPESVYAHPACIRFGRQDPRSWHFDWLLLLLEEGGEPEEFEKHLAALRSMGFDLTLNPGSKVPPTLPIMTLDERQRYKRGDFLPWMHPLHIAGEDE